MTFLAVLGALIAERYLLRLQHLRSADWFSAYFDWHQSLPIPASWRSGAVGYAGLLLAPVGLTLLGEHLLSGWIAGIPELVFGVLVLLYTLGPHDLDTEVKALVAARQRGDQAAAQALAADLSIGPGDDSTEALCHGILIRANRRIFAVLLWFLLLGPAGAMLYRFSRHIERLARDRARAALLAPTGIALRLLDWLPCRITAFGYGLGGCFPGALAGWRGCVSTGILEPGDQRLGCAGFGALSHGSQGSGLDGEAGPRLAMELVWRALAIGVGLLGLVTAASFAA